MKIGEWLLIIWWFGVSGAYAAQPPEEKRPTERRSGDAQNLPLNRLPVPDNGMIVVTPDLKKAMDALGAGSVVLSAERYQELMNRAERNKDEKSSKEILFARCVIKGDVKLINGRELADLTFELEFRTETPGTMIPLPFRGIRISSASLNGQPPIWGPDPEKLSLVIREPQVSKLRLSTSIPVLRVGQEKRLTLERVPASAITSLELLVPGAVPRGTVLGYGNVTAQAVEKGNTLLIAPALGVLSSLDLTWQAADPNTATALPTIEGDIRVNLDETHAQIEGRLKPVPFMPIQLPWKVRLPKNSQQVRAELTRADGGNAEQLVVTRQADGLHLLNTPYSINPLGFSHVVVRWQQPMPDGETAESVLVGSCEVIEPAGRQQTGLMLLSAPDDAPALLKAKQLMSLDRLFPTNDRESRRTQRYRYQQQPAGFEAVALPRQLTRGAIEARMNYSLTAVEGGWLLGTEIEILRSNRANLAVLELAWPAEWPVSRKLLFSPAVKEIDQDFQAERVRVIMDGRQPESLTLKLESMLPTLSKSLLVKLPQLLSASNKPGAKAQPIDVIIQQEKFRLDANGWDLQTGAGMSGLTEEGSEASSRKDTRLYQVISRPAQITVTRQPKLPKWSSTVDVFVGREQLKTRQTINMRWIASPLRKVRVLIPVAVKSVQFVRVLPDGRSEEFLTKSPGPTEEGSPWKRWMVDLPVSTEKTCSMICICEQDSTHPITVPLARIDEAEATHEGPVSVHCVHDGELKLTMPGELTGWAVVQQDHGKLEITGNSLQPLLILERQDDAGERRPRRVRQSIMKLEEEGTGWLIELETSFAEQLTSELSLKVHAHPEDVDIIGWKINGSLMPMSLTKTSPHGPATHWQFSLSPEYLLKPVKLSVAFHLKRNRTSFWSSIPGVVWGTGDSSALSPMAWHIRCEPSNWLWWTNSRVDERMHLQHGWLPDYAMPLNGTSHPAYLCLQSSSDGSTLYLLVIPRFLSVIVLSGISFVLVNVFARQSTTRRSRLVWILAFGMLVLFVIEPGAAAALLWSAIPGVILSTIVLGWSQGKQHFQRRKPAVFQRTSDASPSTVIRPHIVSPISMIQGDAPTIVTNLPQAQSS